MLMLNFSHDLHFPPFIHFIGESVLVDKIVAVPLFILKRMFVQVTSNSLSTNIGPNGAFIVNESFNNGNYMSVLCPDINYETAF